jgi:hypothetical protein
MPEHFQNQNASERTITLRYDRKAPPGQNYNSTKEKNTHKRSPFSNLTLNDI